MGNIQINNLSFRYDGMTTNIFDDFSLNIDESWRLGLIGRNGRGKTTFLKLLLGKLTDHGAIQTSVQFNYFPQPVTDPTQETVDVLTAVAGIGSADVWKIQLEMDKLKLNDDILDRPFATLSPGEQTKRCSPPCLLMATPSSSSTSRPIIWMPRVVKWSQTISAISGGSSLSATTVTLLTR